MKSIQVVLVATVIFSAVYAARPKRYYVPRSQPLSRRPNETPDDGEPDLSVYPTPEWMQRIIHPKDYNAGVEGWATQERRCSVATVLADDLCDGLHQALPEIAERQPLRLVAEDMEITNADRLANIKVLPHGNYSNQGFKNKGLKYRFWGAPTEPRRADLHLHPQNGEVEARIAGTYLIVSHITFNSRASLQACYHIKSSHRHRDPTKTELLTTALYQMADNRFKSCITECSETTSFTAQMSVSATAVVRLRVGERVWLEACSELYSRKSLIVLKPNLTHLTLLPLF
ncbi:hypothetical protein CAPTEDRAFT_213761 [Capitella teleta]|uniref:Uncharacterized protein n=1 Tax=Capitella teleta TaxID=283909 RepID=R7U779_CAPTE|nr:hypothetical protein CAPTEDRAFT_213761 [Capitella teleta]|eukprot:ELU02225.1 hypothetical protein CAPTEDRAFT_213761 [Capitella teleta]